MKWYDAIIFPILDVKQKVWNLKKVEVISNICHYNFKTSKNGDFMSPFMNG
jgi:hypothetical protein